LAADRHPNVAHCITPYNTCNRSQAESQLEFLLSRREGDEKGRSFNENRRAWGQKVLAGGGYPRKTGGIEEGEGQQELGWGVMGACDDGGRYGWTEPCLCTDRPDDSVSQCTFPLIPGMSPSKPSHVSVVPLERSEIMGSYNAPDTTEIWQRNRGCKSEKKPALRDAGDRTSCCLCTGCTRRERPRPVLRNGAVNNGSTQLTSSLLRCAAARLLWRSAACLRAQRRRLVVCPAPCPPTLASTWPPTFPLLG